jgi:hypothetical protein
MTMAELLEDRLHYAGVWYLEKADRQGVETTDEEQRLADHYMHTLAASVGQVPAEMLAAAQELLDKNPEKFEDTLVALIQRVGPNFMPANASEFVEQLNKNVQGAVPA